MNIKVMIPTYNEKQSIYTLLSQLALLNIPETGIKILIIDDN